MYRIVNVSVSMVTYMSACYAYNAQLTKAKHQLSTASVQCPCSIHSSQYFGQARRLPS